MTARRVVVTGIGVVTPLGVGVNAFWPRLCAGESGTGPISTFDASGLTTRIAAEVRGFDPLAFLSRRDVVRTDPFIHYALTAANEAIRDAGLRLDTGRERVGVAIGTAFGGMSTLVGAHETLERSGAGAVSPYVMPGFLSNMAAGWVAARTGARGPISAPTTACAAGAQAIGDAFRTIQRGDATVMIAGGAEAPITPLVVACFNSLGVLSTRNDDPAAASRPFDDQRDGFVLGEGAGVLVLEALDAARARDARIYGELAGYGLTSDAHHPTLATTEGPARAITNALAEAGVAPAEVSYINAHGSSTRHNDANETRVIRQVFGPAARRVAISSTKSMLGHQVGAAGAVEAAVCVLALTSGTVPPTINHRTPDPECDLDYVPNVARALDVEVAVSNSFAYGGVNAILVFRRERG